MEGIDSCDADGCGRARDTWGHDRQDCSRDRGEVVGSDRGKPHCPHPPDASISTPGGREAEVDMKRVEEGSLESLNPNDASGLRAGGRRNIDDNNNERVEVEEAPRVTDILGMEGEAADDYGEYGIDGGDGGSP